MPAVKLVLVPDGLDEVHAVAAGLQALTAQFLAESIGGIEAGDSALVHAGAGGVGLLLIQLLKLRGARVLTTVSTAEKAALAREAGADEAILYTQADFVTMVKAATGGSRREGGLRLRRQDDRARQPVAGASARDAGAVWPVERRGAADRPAGADAAGFDLSDAADPFPLHRRGSKPAAAARRGCLASSRMAA